MNKLLIIGLLILVCYNLAGFYLRYIRKKNNKEYRKFYRSIVFVGYIGISLFIIGVILYFLQR